MKAIKVGTDIVDVDDFKETLKTSGPHFLTRVFTKTEQKNPDAIHLAGLFAAKEAVMKALEIKPGKWLEIEILHEKSGRPYVNLSPKFMPKMCDLSISHTKTTAIAVFIAYTD